MKMKEREALAKTGAILITAGVLGLNYLRIKRSEEKKQEKIHQWKLENEACIKNYRDTMEKLATDPNVDAAEFWRRFHEESAFVNIMVNRPMY